MAYYLEVHQSRDHEPTQYENLLGDSIERAYAQGITDLGELVDYLNRTGPAPRDGKLWTETAYAGEMARLGS